MNINIVLLLLPFLLVVPTYARLNAAGNKDLLTELSEEEYLSKKGGRGEGGRGDEQQIASLSSVVAAVVDEDIVVEGEDDGDSDDDFFPDVPCKCDTFPYIFCPAPIQCEEECGNRSLCNFCFMSTKVGTSCDCSALPWPLC